MTRTVTDAAIMLGAMEGAQPDPNDPATTKCPPPAGRDYTRFLNPTGLQGRAHRHSARVLLRRNGGRRIGAARRPERRAAQGRWTTRSPCSRRRARSIVDPADIPSVIDTDSANNFLNWNVRAAGSTTRKGSTPSCSVAFKYGMKRDFNAWLKIARRPRAGEDADRAARSGTSRTSARARSSTGRRISTSRTRWTSQADRARYEADRRKDIRLSATNGLDAALKANRLDALLFPGVTQREHRGAPGLSDGHGAVGVRCRCRRARARTRSRRASTPKPAPFNVSFTGTACSEPKLIELAYAFEQATKKRHRPPLFP